MTEAAPQITSSPLPPRQRKPGSAASPPAPHPDCPGRRYDRRSRRAGEILVNGPNVMAGTRMIRRHGGGLRGRLVQDRRCRPSRRRGVPLRVGRQKEIVKCGGETISPREVEEVLLAHPAVADAVAFPVPDDRLLQVVGAAIVPRRA